MISEEKNNKKYFIFLKKSTYKFRLITAGLLKRRKGKGSLDTPLLGGIKKEDGLRQGCGVLRYVYPFLFLLQLEIRSVGTSAYQ